MHDRVDRRRIDAEIVRGKDADVGRSAGSQIGEANGNGRTRRDTGRRGDRRRRVESRRAVRDLVGETRRRGAVANGDKTHLHDGRSRTVRRAEHSDLGFWPCGSKSDDQHAAAAGTPVIGAGVVAAAAAAAEAVHARFGVELLLRSGDPRRLVAGAHTVSAAANAASAGIVVVTAAAAAAGVVDLLAGDVACLAGASGSVRSGVLVARAVSARTARAAAAAAFGTAGKALAFRAGAADAAGVAAAAAASAGGTGAILPNAAAAAADCGVEIGAAKRKNGVSAVSALLDTAVQRGIAAFAARADRHRIRAGREYDIRRFDKAARTAAAAAFRAAAAAAAHEEKPGRRAVGHRERAVREEFHDRGLIGENRRRDGIARRRHVRGHESRGCAARQRRTERGERKQCRLCEAFHRDVLLLEWK